jgi:hypothetical protein
MVPLACPTLWRVHAEILVLSASRTTGRAPRASGRSIGCPRWTKYALWHHRRIAIDERRDRKLTRLGYRILHLDAAFVTQQPSVAAERIREAIAAAQWRYAKCLERNVALPRRHYAICITTIPRRETTIAPSHSLAASTKQNPKRRHLDGRGHSLDTLQKSSRRGRD